MVRLFILFFIISFALRAQQNSPGEWLTYFEKSGGTGTPNYNESLEYFRQFEKYSPFVKIITIGETPQGRALYCIIITKGKEFTAELAHKSGKAIVLVQNGIHAGEIEGKDACMILLREMLVTKEKEALLDNNIFLVIPVINADGHERISPYNRINQNGPVEMGWRTTAQNLNLNRDFMKADAPEMQAFLKLYNAWLPDFFIDSHTTDGADYQYTVTYSVEHSQNIDLHTGAYLKKEFIPYFESYVEKDGFLVCPYVSFKDNKVSNGISDWAAMPRLSNGYAAIQNRPSLLIETHMLKHYKDRVYSTKSCISAVLEYCSKHFREIKKINEQADKNSISNFVINKKALPLIVRNTGTNPTMFNYKGFREVYDSSWITGKKIIRYSDEKYTMEIPYYNRMYVADSVYLAENYLIPAEWREVINKVELHGIKYSRLEKPTKFIVEKTKFTNVKFAAKPYEGRLQPEYEIIKYTDTVIANEGDCLISTNQRTVRLIGALFEAKSLDSFLKWGLFNTIFEQKEYFEDYSMEPIAREMADNNPSLKNEFLKKLESDENFRNNENARLNFFYERSEYYDEKYNVYPVLRILGEN